MTPDDPAGPANPDRPRPPDPSEVGEPPPALPEPPAGWPVPLFGDPHQHSIHSDGLGTVEDVTGIVVFLASTEAGYVTGQVFPVDGGMVM